MTPTEQVRVARAYLSRVAEPPAAPVVAFVAEVGPVEAAARIRRGEVPEAVAKRTAARRTVDRAAADLAAAAGCGARLVVPEDEEWPHWTFLPLDRCPDEELAAPLALWARGPGRLDELTGSAVAIVGSRNATGYGSHVSGELAAGAADRGFTVVSGAALGIDGAAHRGALAVDGPTIAVLACGIDRAYPAAHDTLLGRIAATALVVSEYPPGSVPARHRFLVRNRLIAGLAAGTVVVEAGLRSGAARTAGDTAALGRPVMAVPGRVTDGAAAGCHQLIRRGAVLVTRTEEVLEVVGRIGLDLASPEEAPPAGPVDGLDRGAALVHDALPSRGARDTRWIAMEAALTTEEVRRALVDLERRGLAELCDEGWRRVVSRA
ncbi:DNA-processing protein DprA [Pseudonocardia sp.]|uniref:DNA-processing protein DprA n=1 Tax=Pseudonocardia sp. TaxID=60912 RepID=UPI003D0C4700